MSRLVSLAVCVAVLSSCVVPPALAAEPANKAPTAAAMACAERYMTSLDMEKTMLALMNGMMPAMMAQMPESDRVDATLKAKILEAINEGVVAVLPLMLKEMTPALAVHFSEAEVCALADFYDSPTGRSIIAKMPAYTQDTSVMSARFVPLMQQEMMTRLCRKIDCTGGAAKTPTRSDS